MLKAALPRAFRSQGSRSAAIIPRCTANAQNDAILLARPGAPATRPPASDASAAPTVVAQPAPAAEAVTAAAAPATSTVAADAAAANAVVAESKKQNNRRRGNVWKSRGGGRRGAGRDQRSQQQASEVGQARKKDPLPYFVFLEDDAEGLEGKAQRAMEEHLTRSERKSVVVRCLGRQGVLGALRFIAALRDLGDHAERKGDVHVGLLPQRAFGVFGTPLMLFVNWVEGRAAAPPDAAAPIATFTLTLDKPVEELMRPLRNAITGLRNGGHIQVEMVGLDAIHHGMKVLDSAGRFRGSRGRLGSYFVPQLVAEPGAQPRLTLYIWRNSPVNDAAPSRRPASPVGPGAEAEAASAAAAVELAQ